MKLNFLVRSTLLLTLGIALFSCQKGDGPMGQTGPAGPTGPTGPTGSTGPQGPKLKGSLSGYVTLFDQYGSKILNNQGGVKVTLDGTSYSATTDSTGKWVIDSLQTGVYTATCSKSLFGDIKVPSIQFVGGGNVDIKNISLTQVPVYQLNSTLVTKDSLTIIPATTDTIVKGISVAGTFQTSDSRQRSVVLFVGKSGSVSSDPATYLFAIVRNPFVVDKKNPNGLNFTMLVSADDLHNAGFKKGDIVYVAAYPASNAFNSASNYQDLATGRNIYKGIGSTASSSSRVLAY